MQNKLDQLDLKIIWHLDLQSRRSLTALADDLRISKQLLNYRLKRLRDEQILRGAYAVIDNHRLGCLTFRIYYRLRNIEPSHKKEIVNYFCQNPFTLWVVSIDGSWDLEVVFTVRNSVHLNNILKKALLKLGRFYERFSLSVSPVSYHLRRDYLIAATRKDFSVSFYGYEPTLGDWDKLDFDILGEIAENSRQKNEELGRKLKVSYHTVRKRIDKLEEMKVIQCYRPLIAAQDLGRRYMKALLILAPMSQALTKRFYRFLARSGFVIYLTEVLGDWQLEVECEVLDQSELYKLIRSARSEFPDYILDFDVIEVTTEHKINYLPMGNKAYAELVTATKTVGARGEEPTLKL